MKNYTFAEQRLIGFADGGGNPEMQVVPQKEKKDKNPDSTDTGDKSKEINEKSTQLHLKMDKFQSLARRLKPAEMKQWQESLNRRVEDINKTLVTNQVDAIKKIEAAIEDIDVIINYQEVKNTKDVVDVVRKGDEVTITVPLMRKMKPTQVCAVEGTGPRSICFVGQNEKGWQWKIITPTNSGARAKISFEDGQTMTVDINKSGDYRDYNEGDKVKTELKKVNKVEENLELTEAANRFKLIKDVLDKALDKYKKSNTQKDLDAYRQEVIDAIGNRKDRINERTNKTDDPVSTMLRKQIVELQNDYLQPFADKRGKAEKAEKKQASAEKTENVETEQGARKRAGEEYLKKTASVTLLPNGEYKLDATGATNYLFKFNGGSSKWEWHYEGDATLHSMDKIPADKWKDDATLNPATEVPVPSNVMGGGSTKNNTVDAKGANTSHPLDNVRYHLGTKLPRFYSNGLNNDGIVEAATVIERLRSINKR